jgi:hypothetical protein
VVVNQEASSKLENSPEKETQEMREEVTDETGNFCKNEKN